MQTESSGFRRSGSKVSLGVDRGALDNTDDPGAISAQDLAEIRKIISPPDVVRRTLEVTCLILACCDRIPKPEAPSWQTVQRKLGDSQFVSQVLSCDPVTLRAAKSIMNFIAMEYFGTGDVAAIPGMAFTRVPVGPARATIGRVSMRDLMRHGRPGSRGNGAPMAKLFRSTREEPVQEPLNVDRVLRANATAATLLRWCIAMLEIASSAAVTSEKGSHAQAVIDTIRAQVLAAPASLPSLPDAPHLTSPRLQKDRRPSAVPTLTMSPRFQSGDSSASAPSSFRLRVKPERLQPLPSSPSAAIGLSSAKFLLDSSIEKVQSLAMAKIEQQRATRPPQSVQPTVKDPVPAAVTIPVPIKSESEDDYMAKAWDLIRRRAAESSDSGPQSQSHTLKTEVTTTGDADFMAKAKEMMRRRAEEKAQLFSDPSMRRKVAVEVEESPKEPEEEEPWKAFHASYMRADWHANPGDPEPAKVADKGLKNMEKAMKLWEDRMKKAAKSDVEVKQDGRTLLGGFLEACVCFAADSSELTEKQESLLRPVAATMRMRRQLHLQLIGCGVELDGAFATMSRLCSVQQWFEADGIECNAVHAVRASNGNFVSGEKTPAVANSRHILCRLHMNDDMELCGHLLGTLTSSNKKTRDQAAWLKSNFEIITY